VDATTELKSVDTKDRTAWYVGQEGTAVPSWPTYQAVTYTD